MEISLNDLDSWTTGPNSKQFKLTQMFLISLFTKIAQTFHSTEQNGFQS